MSLGIDVENVVEVLLADGSWYTVHDRSFTISGYDFWSHEGGVETMLHPPDLGDDRMPGFQFETDKDAIMSGPLTAVLAVIEE